MANKLTFILLGSMLAQSPARAADPATQPSYEFLTSDLNAGGILYTATAGALQGRQLPLSFRDSAAYWAEHVCTITKACNVVDVYNPADYTLRPAPGPGAELQTERVNVHNGANIYDAATWQIAVMLGAATARGSEQKQPYELVGNQNLLLKQSHDGRARVVAPGANRAVSRDALFIYNGQRITQPAQAYSFRMLAQTWLADDPFIDTAYASWIRVSTALPADRSEYRAGKVSWSDWKPITGENAWAFLIGPLQAAQLHYVQQGRQSFIPFSDLAVQNALDVLPAFAALQSSLGAVYYAPSGTLGNRGERPINPHEVSVENNFSLYAGLKLLDATLRAERAQQKDLSSGDKARIDAALATIQLMIHGGQMSGKRTAGLLSFFKNAAWRDGEFMQGGWADDTQQKRAWTPNLGAKAVDVNTWGVAALGAKQVDDWFGFGAAYRIWQRVKSWGAYGVGKTLWGVGFSDRDGNGVNPAGEYRSGVLSSEWTAGAVNMLRNMSAYYGSIPPTSEKHGDAQQYLAALQRDEAAMLEGVENLRFDRYQRASFEGKPAGYAGLLQSKSGAYVYASKRYEVPFGWYANPLPSTCSTAWMIMIAHRYDPFGYAGRPN